MKRIETKTTNQNRQEASRPKGRLQARIFAGKKSPSFQPLLSHFDGSHAVQALAIQASVTRAILEDVYSALTSTYVLKT